MKELNEAIAAAAAANWPGEDRIPVFGEGHMGARVMLIGEAPGEQETLQRRPFVGKAGKNLNEFLELAGMRRDDLYVTNVVKLRPTKLSKAGRIVNRPPNTKEIACFLPFLLQEIQKIAPEVVVTLGNTPLQALMGRQTVIGDVHGKMLQREGYRLYPMYHPASLIYNRGLTDTYREDILKLAALLSATQGS